MTEGEILAILENTQDYSDVGVDEAMAILRDTRDQYHRHLLAAELNAAWNDEVSQPLPGDELGSAVYFNPSYPGSFLNGRVVREIAQLAFATSPGDAGSDLVAFVFYVGSIGEGAPEASCRLRAP